MDLEVNDSDELAVSRRRSRSHGRSGGYDEGNVQTSTVALPRIGREQCRLVPTIQLILDFVQSGVEQSPASLEPRTS